jgi:ankyrin repeat protein
VYCQLEYLSDCLPGRIQEALDELPDTLDGTYERTLREIKNTNWEFARRLFLCAAVASRPFRVEELAEFLAFDFNARPIPKYREDWCLDDSMEAVLSTCSTLLAVVTVDDYSVIQFSHFSVKEFLTSTRLAESRDDITRRYHVSVTPAHTLVAQACLGMLLHLDENITRDGLKKFPLAEYAAKHWIDHACFEGVWQCVEEGIKLLFCVEKGHFAVWIWIHEPNWVWRCKEDADSPLPPLGTPLHYAAFCGLHGIVRFLAAGHPLDVHSQCFDTESTPLHVASEEGHVEVARFLVEHGADTMAQDGLGRTPLHGASDSGSDEIARFLVEHGADATTQDAGGLTPLHYASGWGYIDLARFLVEHGAVVGAQDKNGRTPLHRASGRGRAQVARFLVEHGADVTTRDKYMWTPLHRAMEDVNLARFLIDHGADMRAQDNYGHTPLHKAIRSSLVDSARFLIEHGADVTIRDNDGRIPLHWASRLGCRDHNVELVRLLVEHGADVTAQDKQRLTPLHVASEVGHVKTARFLVKQGANVAAQDKHGQTPLHWASGKGNVEVALFLVERGADATARDKHGQTPLHVALREGHADLARSLVEHGGDAEAQAMAQIQLSTT